jgi:hypothetical protein
LEASFFSNSSLFIIILFITERKRKLRLWHRKRLIQVLFETLIGGGNFHKRDSGQDVFFQMRIANVGGQKLMVAVAPTPGIILGI